MIFAGAALAQVSQRVADETLDLLLAHGVNHLDVASSYGEAEVRIRPWLEREPGRSGHQGRRADRSPARRAPAPVPGPDGRRPRRPLATARPGRSDRVGHAESAALEGALSRDQGLIRWTGVTGHAARSPRRTAAASIGSTSTRCCSVQLRHHENPYYVGNFDADETCRERERGADDQVDRAATVGARPHTGQPGTSR